MAYIKGEAVTQGSLFPVSLDELVPGDHIVRVVAAYVDRLSLTVANLIQVFVVSWGIQI